MISESQKRILIEHILPIKPFRIGIFGSYSRNQNKPDSDLDVLIHLNYDYPVSLLKLAGIQEDLTEELGVKVDLVTEKSLSPYLRPYIEKDIVYIY